MPQCVAVIDLSKESWLTVIAIECSAVSAMEVPTSACGVLLHVHSFSVIWVLSNLYFLI